MDDRGYLREISELRDRLEAFSRREEALKARLDVADDLAKALEGCAGLICRIAAGEDWGAIEEYADDAYAAIAKFREEPD